MISETVFYFLSSQCEFYVLSLEQIQEVKIYNMPSKLRNLNFRICLVEIEIRILNNTALNKHISLVITVLLPYTSQ